MSLIDIAAEAIMPALTKVDLVFRQDTMAKHVPIRVTPGDTPLVRGGKCGPVN